MYPVMPWNDDYTETLQLASATIGIVADEAFHTPFLRSALQKLFPGLKITPGQPIWNDFKSPLAPPKTQPGHQQVLWLNHAPAVTVPFHQTLQSSGAITALYTLHIAAEGDTTDALQGDPMRTITLELAIHGKSGTFHVVMRQQDSLLGPLPMRFTHPVSSIGYHAFKHDRLLEPQGVPWQKPEKPAKPKKKAKTKHGVEDVELC